MQLLHGNCLDIMPSLPRRSIDMVLADWPFGTTANDWDVALDFDTVWSIYRRLMASSNSAIVLFGAQPFTSRLIASNWRGYKHSWVWDKGQAGNFAVAKHMPLTTHEDIVVFTLNGEKVNYYPQMVTGKMRMRGSKNSTKHGRGFGGMEQVYYPSDQYYPISILSFPSVPRQNRLHPCEKPVELLRYLLRTYSQHGATILDNTMGSGSTGEACIAEGRNFVGIEMDKYYFDVATNRLGSPRAISPLLPNSACRLTGGDHGENAIQSPPLSLFDLA